MSIDQFLLSATTTDLNYPEVRPTLDLNFARTKTSDPRITFTRASGGTYVGADGLIKYAGVNEARFDHDPVTGESLGLLIEENRTNLKVSSEQLELDFSYASISRVSTNEIISPDGLQTADGLVANNTLGGHWGDKIFTSASGITASQNICASVFFKKGIGRDIYLWMYEESGNAAHWVSFNFDNKTTSFGVTAQYTSGSGVTTGYGVIEYPNGWYRLWIAGYPNTTTTGRRLRIWLSDQTGNISSFSGNQVSSYVYVWGVQVEIGAFPTSYIPTQASTRTRAADNALITGKNFSEWYRQDEGTVFAKYKVQNFIQGSFPRIYSIDRRDSSANFIAAVRNNFVNRTDYSVFIGPPTTGQAIGLNTAENLIPGTTASGAWVYKNNDFIGAVNGKLTNYDTNGVVPSSLTTLGIGMQGNNALHYNGTISRLTYYPKRLPNAQLQALTK